MKDNLVPMTGWIDVNEEKFPDKVFFAGYFSDRNCWILRGPFLDEDRARESLKHYERPRKIFTYKLENVETLLKVRRPKERKE